MDELDEASGQGAPDEKVTRRLEALAGEEFGYLTTTGRVSGTSHEIEIWFAVENERVYVLSGGGEGADWVKNLRRTPEVTLQLGKTIFAGRGRVVTEVAEDALARRLLAGKYEQWREGKPMSSWARVALPMALDVTGVVG